MFAGMAVRTANAPRRSMGQSMPLLPDVLIAHQRGSQAEPLQFHLRVLARVA